MARADALTTAGGFLLALALIPAFWPGSASAAPEGRDAICAGYRGTALWGQCTRAVASGCAESEIAHPRCQQWAQQWEDQTDETPPWLLLCGDGFGSKCVFVTSATYTGNLGGLDGADQKCADEARAEGSQAARGTYKAWLSTTDASPAGARFTHPEVPYVRVDGEEVAQSFAVLVSPGQINAATITVTANGQVAGGPEYAWTGTTPSGLAKPNNCISWTFGNFVDEFGTAGNTTNLANGYWTDWTSSVLCVTALHLYCFQQ